MLCALLLLAHAFALRTSKTTLLNYILETVPHKLIAVIENEFGDEIGSDAFDFLVLKKFGKSV